MRERDERLAQLCDETALLVRVKDGLERQDEPGGPLDAGVVGQSPDEIVVVGCVQDSGPKGMELKTSKAFIFKVGD